MMRKKKKITLKKIKINMGDKKWTARKSKKRSR